MWRQLVAEKIVIVGRPAMSAASEFLAARARTEEAEETRSDDDQRKRRREEEDRYERCPGNFRS